MRFQFLLASAVDLYKLEAVFHVSDLFLTGETRNREENRLWRSGGQLSIPGGDDQVSQQKTLKASDFIDIQRFTVTLYI